MRSTLLFVAVLLACTPVHAQATAPAEVPILNAWLSAILPAATTQAPRKTVAKRPRTAPMPAPSATVAQAYSPVTATQLPTRAATPLLYDPNAP